MRMIRSSLLPLYSNHSRNPLNHNHHGNECFSLSPDNPLVDQYELIVDQIRRKYHAHRELDVVEVGTKHQSSRMMTQQNCWLAFLRNPFQERFDDMQHELSRVDEGNHVMEEPPRLRNYNP